MANITLSGTLLDPNSGFAARDKIRFTHKTTTGSTLKGSVSTLVIGADGAYSIDLQYGLVLVERRDSTKSQYINLGVVTVNADNPATTLPELLSASVPVSSEQLIEFQSILADCLAAQAAAEAAAAEAAQLGTNTGASLVGTSSGATVQQSLDALTAGQTGGLIVFATYALLDAYTPQNATEEKSSFKVTNDSNTALNGYYSWVSGTTYTKDADIVLNTIDEANTSDAVSGKAVSDYAAKAELMSDKNDPNLDYAIVDSFGKMALSVNKNGQVTIYDEINPISDIDHFLIIGQSLAHGYNSSPAITTVDTMNNNTFNNNPRSTVFSAITPLIEIDSALEGETPCSGLSGQIKRSIMGFYKNISAVNSNYQSICSTHASNASTIAGISKGTGSYENAQNAVLSGSLLAQGYNVRAIFMIQGEADERQRTPRTTYKEAEIQLKDDHTADIRVTLNNPEIKIPFITYQTNHRYVYTTPITALAQLDAAEEDEDIYMATPIYFLDVSDHTHLTPHSSRWLGEMLGKVYRNIINGENWKPVTPISILGSGTSEILVKFHVPRPPLVFDLDMVVDPSNFGFEVVDDSGAVTINKITIIDAFTVKIDLASPLTANPKLRYAYTNAPSAPSGPLTGARGNLRDSDNTMSNYLDASGERYKLYNWCVTFEKDVN